MPKDELILKIDAALADSLRARAEAVGQSVEAYVLHRLKPEELTQGFGERETAYWEDIQRICDETERDGGIPWEQVQARLRNFGQKR